MIGTSQNARVIDASALRQAVLRHVTYSLGSSRERLSAPEWFHALALSLRDVMVEGLLATEERYRRADAKRLYYLSMEFLIGRSLRDTLLNLGLRDAARSVLEELGGDLEAAEDSEVDAALGNGGLGRLAACFLESLATLNLPGFGYGINYEYGLFKQEIRGGEQVEKPDNWRTYYTPWQIQRPQETILVPVYGRIEHATDRRGNYNPMWLDWKMVVGVPHDMPIVGHGGRTVNYLRLFSARAIQEVDLTFFNAGDYIHAVEQQVLSETISKVLYPSESAAAGRELRLLQEYFLSACAVRDVVRRFLADRADFDALPDRVAIQLNDTHPTLAVVELMRLLIDENDLPWEKAWDLTCGVFAYTNHTLMSEALERWPVPLLERVVPRHLQLIYEINHRFLQQVARRWPGDEARLQRMSLIEESEPKQVRMAHLAIVGSHSVNGVAELHSRLVQTELVPDFYAWSPEKFNNKTNGVTPRRWLRGANPALAQLITEAIGDRWTTDLEQLRGLEPFAEDSAFRDRFLGVKRGNKERLGAVVRRAAGLLLDPGSLFDVQVKRIHEYKRQLLNLLHVIHCYLLLADEGVAPRTPRTWVFAGKAAPGYHAAKQIIRLIHDVAAIVNRDPRCSGSLKVVFVPDYRVSLAEVIIPAADLSEQISTAGTEASGTSNMKFAMNGALTVGTLDGANVELCQEIGGENLFIFGLTLEQVRRLQATGAYNPAEICRRNVAIHNVLTALRDGRFCPENRDRHAWVYHKLLDPREPYYHLADLESYLRVQTAAAELYRDHSEWTKKAILNVSRTGKFSSDATVSRYAQEVWNLVAIP